MRTVEILTVPDEEGTACFQPICSIATTFRPIALTSELIAFSDDGLETIVTNWRENTFALLKGSQRPIDERFQYVSVSCIIHEDQSLIVVTIQQLSSGCLRL